MALSQGSHQSDIVYAVFEMNPKAQEDSILRSAPTLGLQEDYVGE